MPKTVPSLQENKKPFHRRNGSGEIHVFESARYFESSYDTTLFHKHYMREDGGRLSLDIPNTTRRNSIPLQAMMMDNRNSVPLQSMLMDQNPMMIKNDIKKHKQPSSPGGKLAHFLNSLFNQTSKKSKSKSKSTTSTYSIKDEDESPSGWRRRRRCSISLFRSGNSNSNINVSDTKSTYSKTTQPQAPTKSTTTTYKDLRASTCEITKMPLIENHNKNETLMIKSVFPEPKISNVKHDDDHHKKFDPTVEVKELKSFIFDDGGESDSSSDLFELTNCDLGYYSSGLPVFETTRMDNIKRGAPISS
ncbi:uncharacterized protein LOC143539164 [Bidens hawaiensis]|uniref:uncharacterized protein LOC143539164 n=1 Tax=Bidens hawaiensis TaxID=980011 RepID=UPI00404B8B2B